MILRAIMTKIFGGNANNPLPEVKQFEEVTEELLENAGFDLKAFIRMDDDLAIKYLEDRRDFNIPNLEDLALILEKLGAADQGATDKETANQAVADPDSSQQAETRLRILKKALLILEHCRDKDRTYSFERESRIGALKTAGKKP